MPTRTETSAEMPPVSAEGSEVPAPGFRVVGIGASAGGLEAIRALLQHLELERLAVVVVQHLSPQHESVLPNLLGKYTQGRVVQAADAMPLEMGQVYVIPPGADLAVQNGALRVMTPGAGTSHQPIDYFLRSLADDLGHRAIGVVLSGTGSDGTLGLKTVKSAGGITFAQNPDEAKFEQMPRSASDSGWADLTLSVEAIAKELNAIGRRPFAASERPANAQTQDTVAKLIVLMRTAFGNDLTYYKPSTIERRIERRMALHKLDRHEDYLQYVVGNPDELKVLYKDMLISVTSFFRDREPFEVLKTQIFPRMMAGKEPGAQIRIWVPACSTGEEAYSFAMCLLEFLDNRAQDYRIQIFGTDIDEGSIAAARRGCYPLNITLDVSPERLHRFFLKKDDEYQIARRIRDMVVFSIQNVTKDPPFSRLDLVSCRNLLIYLQPQMQRKVLRVLHYSLNTNGHLVLGTSETVGESELFSLIDRKTKIYAKKQSASLSAGELGFGTQAPAAARPIQPNMNQRGAADISSLAERKILELFGPPGVVINDDLEVVHIRGRTGPYLEPMPGAPSFNILKLARPEIHVDLRRALHEAQTTGGRVSVQCHLGAAPDARPFRLEVVPITDPDTKARCFLVLFHEPLTEVTLFEAREEPVGTPEAQRVQELERELLVTKEYLQSTIEELEGGSEELKSSNEELQSANEELQSTNEELETSKEELQSTNEELSTVNDELQSRMAELQQSNDDLHNVLAGVGNAVVIIGMDLRIRRYTQIAEKILNLVPGDVGRSVSQLNAFIQGHRVEEMAAEVIQRLMPSTHEVLGSDRRWYELTITPYRTLDQSIKGAVIVLIDIDVRKRWAQLAKDVAAFADDFYKLIEQPLAIVDRKSALIWVNEPFAKHFEVSRVSARGAPLSRFLDSSELDASLRRAIDDRVDFQDLQLRNLKLSGTRIPPIGGEEMLVLMSIEAQRGSS